MKTKNISAAILREIAEKEYGLATEGLTKPQLVEAIGDDEIEDELYAQYNPASVPQGPNPVIPSAPVGTLEALLAKAKAQDAEDKAILAASQAERSKYEMEPVECEILITGINDRGQVKTTSKTKPWMEMVTVTGIAFPETHKIECKVTTNVEWLRDYSIEVGRKTRGRIGIYKDSAREEQAAQILERRGLDIRTATEKEIREAKAVVGTAHLILGDNINTIGDLIDTKNVKRQLTVSQEIGHNTVVEAQMTRSLDATRRLRTLMA